MKTVKVSNEIYGMAAQLAAERDITLSQAMDILASTATSAAAGPGAGHPGSEAEPGNEQATENYENHRHGMSDPGCPECIEVVNQSLIEAEQRGYDKANAEWENRNPEENMITIVGDNNPEENMITVISDVTGEPLSLDEVKETLRRANRELKAEQNIVQAFRQHQADLQR